MTEILTIKKIRNKACAKKIKVRKVQEGMDRNKGDKTYIPELQEESTLFQAYRRTHLRQGD